MTERGIINTHDQLRAAGGGVAITVAYGSGRDHYVSGWHVYRLGADGKQIPTDPGAPFYQHGCKWFGLLLRKGSFHERKRHAAAEAQAWVKEQGWYAGEWKRNAMGDFVPADTQKRFPIRRREKT